MPQPILIPGYDRTAWFADDYPQSLVTPEKVVLHSTEGGTLPATAAAIRAASHARPLAASALPAFPAQHARAGAAQPLVDPCQ